MKVKEKDIKQNNYDRSWLRISNPELEKACPEEKTEHREMNGLKRDKSRSDIKKAQEKVEHPSCLSLTVEELEKFKSNTLHTLLNISIQKLKAIELH